MNCTILHACSHRMAVSLFLVFCAVTVMWRTSVYGGETTFQPEATTTGRTSHLETQPNQSLIDEVKQNERLYEKLQLDVTTKYRHKVNEMFVRYSVVVDSERFRLATRMTSRHPGRSHFSESTLLFDGRLSRSFNRRWTIKPPMEPPANVLGQGQVSDEMLTLINVARPHMFLLADAEPRAPLSIYLSGIQAVLGFPNNDYPVHGPIVVRELGVDEWEGLRCRKVQIESLADRSPVNRWELWLAEDRNLIPVRALGFIYRWSKTVPISEATVGDWKELQEGVWFPVKARCDRYYTKSLKEERKQLLSSRKLYLVLDAVLEPEVTAETFTTLMFPSGTEITIAKGRNRARLIQP